MYSEDKNIISVTARELLCTTEEIMQTARPMNTSIIKSITLSQHYEEAITTDKHTHRLLKGFIDKVVKITGITTSKGGEASSLTDGEMSHLSRAMQEDMLSLQQLAGSESATATLQRWVVQQNADNSEKGVEAAGLLLFALDKCPKDLFEHLATRGTLDLEKWLKECFFHHLHVLKANVAHHHRQHKASGLQPADVAARNAMNVEVGMLLTTRLGTINSSLIPPLMSSLQTDDESAPLYEIEIVKKLAFLKANENLCRMLSTVMPSKSPRAHSNVVIRSCLGLPLETPITQQHAVRTALTALLSHLRQGAAGSCFATSLAINMLAASPEYCLRDFIALFQDDALTRNVDGVSMQFPYLLSTSSIAVTHQITFTRKGKLTHSHKQLNSTLWDAPGLKSVAISLGIKGLDVFLQAWIEEQFKSLPLDQEVLTVPLKAVFEALADKAWQSLESTPKLSRHELYALALFTFEAQISNPLLKAWENAIASMAEAHDTGLMRSSVLNTTLEIVMDEVGRTSRLSPELQQTLANRFYQELGKAIRIQYDPCIDNHMRLSRTSQGAFILYDQKKWQRIDTPLAFQNFCSELWQQALDMAIATATSTDVKLLEHLRSPITQYLLSKHYLLNVVRKFHHRNLALDLALTNLDTLKYTPWVTRIGNNPKKVLQVYLENSQAASTERFTPLSAEQLLTKIIAISRQRANTPDSLTNPYLLTPVRTTGSHSFSLMLRHPSLNKASQQQQDIAFWITKMLIEPGQQLSSTPIAEESREQLLAFAAKELVPPEHQTAFLELSQNLPKVATICQFRSLVVEILEQVAPLTPLAAAQRSRHFDTALCRNLVAQERQLFENTVIHFADTNWYKGLHDIHLCFVFNPGTGQLEIWEACDNDSHFLALDQNAWLKQQEWEFYKLPIPTSERSSYA